MKIISFILLTAALVAVAAPAARAEVPAVIPFAGRLADDSGPIEGTHTFTFRIYDAQEVGTGNQLWTERHMDVAVEDGLVYARLGSLAGTPLGASVLDGRLLYLEIVVDNTTIFSPRLPLESVPYAVRAGTADMFGGYEPDDVQQALTGDCTGGVVVGVGVNGALRCEADDNSGGTVQTITAGNGLTGGGTGAAVSLAVDPTRVQSRVTGVCPTGQFIRDIAESGAVTCGTDANTTYSPLAGGGITVNASQQIGLLAGCSSGQVLKAGPSGWACANDIDTDTTTTYTAVTGGGVSISGTQIGLAPCASGQVLKAGATAGAWTCAADTDTTTTYTAAAGGGVSISGTQIGLLACSANQILKVVGGSWTCAADIDTDTDTNTTYTAAAGGGVAINGTQVGLATCASGQVLKAGATAGTWTCAADASNAGTITGVVGGTGLSGSGTSGSVTLQVDATYVQRRVAMTCAAGTAIRAIAADGTVTCEPKAPRTHLGTVPIVRSTYNGTPTNWTPINYFTFELNNGILATYEYLKPGQAAQARLCTVYTDSGDNAVATPVHLRIRRHQGTEIYYTLDLPSTFAGSGLPRLTCGAWVPIADLQRCEAGFAASCALEVKHDQNRNTIIEQTYVDVAGVN